MRPATASTARRSPHQLAEYERLMGEPIDLDALHFFEISQLTVTLMLQFPVLVEPDPKRLRHPSQVVHRQRALRTRHHGRVLAVELDTLAVPAATPSTYTQRLRHLVTSMRTLARREPKTDLARYGIVVDPTIAERTTVSSAADEFVGWRARCAYRLARHLQRVDEIGVSVDADNRDDIARLTQTELAGDAQADAALLAFIDDAEAGHDIELLRLFAKRLQRLHMTLAPPIRSSCVTATANAQRP